MFNILIKKKQKEKMMNYLLGAFKELWTNFYNSVIRDASSTVRGAIILGLFVAICLLVALAMKGRDKDKFINNWTAFWFAMFFLGLLVVYVILIN